MNAQLKTELLTKTKSHAFGKDCYLIGRDKYGDLIWLEAASWDCSWYWGFGYIEVYTRQSSPSSSKDISSHSHWSGLLGRQDDGDHNHHINEALQETVLLDSESWKLSDLMQSFYTLKKAAEFYHHGCSHLTSTDTQDELKSEEQEKHINETILPRLFEEVYKILTPKD